MRSLEKSVLRERGQERESKKWVNDGTYMMQVVGIKMRETEVERAVESRERQRERDREREERELV